MREEWARKGLREASLSEVSTIGLDIAKQVFQVHGADASGHVLFRKRLTRGKLIEFFRSQPQCLVALEACGGAHHWGRAIAKLGHTVRLIPPAYVKPFVQRQKNDAADSEAICEAAQRPTMRFVPVKDEAQQASGVVFRARDLLVASAHAVYQRPAWASGRVWQCFHKGCSACGDPDQQGRRPSVL